MISAQANFMTVRVPDPTTHRHVELLCIVRALLKKVRERGLVCDYVRVISIDWVEAQGCCKKDIELTFLRATILCCVASVCCRPAVSV